jgi:hypothetical protein
MMNRITPPTLMNIYGTLVHVPKLPHRKARAKAHNPPGRSHGIDAVIIPPATMVARRNRINEMKMKIVDAPPLYVTHSREGLNFVFF